MTNDENENKTIGIRVDDKGSQIDEALNRSINVKPLGEQSLAVRRQAVMVTLGSIGLLATGMGLGAPAVMLPLLTNPQEKVHLSMTQESWFVSIYALSSPLGGLLCGLTLDSLGRKWTLFLLNIFGLIAWALMALAIQNDSDVVFIQLLVARFVAGISLGLTSTPLGVYSAEICLPRIRGRMILLNSIAVAFGITVVYIIGFFIPNDWHLMASICFGYQFMAILCIIPIPESPIWLASKGRLEEAKMSLNFFRGLEKSTNIIHPEVVEEFRIMQESIRKEDTEKNKFSLQLLLLPEVYKPLLIMMGFFGFTQLTGTYVVISYAIQIIIDSDMGIDPFICSALVSLARVIPIFPMGYTLEHWGRRRSGMISAFGMGICMFLMAGFGLIEWLHNLSYLPIVVITSYLILSTLGLDTLPYFMVSELFPLKVRGPATGFSVTFGMIISFVSLITYPIMRDDIGGDFCFVLYGVVGIIAMIFIYLVLPETRGRTLLEIEENFRSGRKITQNTDMDALESFIKR